MKLIEPPKPKFAELIPVIGPLGFGPWTVWLLDLIPITSRMLKRIDELAASVDSFTRQDLINHGADVPPTSYQARVAAGLPGKETYLL